MARRIYPMPEARDGSWEEPPHVLRQGRRPRPGVVARRSNRRPEARAATWRSNPMPKEWWLLRRRRAYRSYPTLKVRKGGRRRYPSSKVGSSSCALLEQLWRDTPHPR